MDKQVFFLAHDVARANAIEAIRQAPVGYAVTIQPKTRSIEQNSRFWAILTDISNQMVWHGKKLAPEDWKHIFTATLRKQIAVPNLEHNGFVVLGSSSSKLNVREMAELQELMTAFAVENNIKLRG